MRQTSQTAFTNSHPDSDYIKIYQGRIVKLEWYLLILDGRYSPQMTHLSTQNECIHVSILNVHEMLQRTTNLSMLRNEEVTFYE